MILYSASGSIPTKRVVIDDVAETETDDTVLDYALKVTGETRSSLFGWSVKINRDERSAYVTLHTD